MFVIGVVDLSERNIMIVVKKRKNDGFLFMKIVKLIYMKVVLKKV